MPIFHNQKPLETFNFAGGECHVRIDTNTAKDMQYITAYLYSSDDIMRLLMSVDAIKRKKPHTPVHLTLPYFPYARQDRVCNEGEALSVKVMADLINGLNCHKITICDPHSDVTAALLYNVEIITMAEIIANSQISKLITQKKLSLLSPDAGAEKKVQASAKALQTKGIYADIVTASKLRDTKNGAILATKLYEDVEGKNLIILDDICDGGRTFIELAKLLKEKKASDVYLYTTHGIYSKGLEVLKPHFKHLYCSHTMLDQTQQDPNFLTILNYERR